MIPDELAVRLCEHDDLPDICPTCARLEQEADGYPTREDR